MSWKSPQQLHKDLDGQGHLDSVEQFEVEVLEKLIDAIKRDETEFTLVSQSVNTAGFVPFLRAYLLGEDFRKTIYTWYRLEHEGKLVPYKEISRTWKEKIDSLTSLEKPLDPEHKETTIDQLGAIGGHLQAVLALAPRDPSESSSYEKDVLALLNQQAEAITNNVVKLHGALQAVPEIKLENENELLEKFAAKWLEEHPEIAAEENAADQAKKAAEAALDELIGSSEKGKQKEVTEAWKKLAKEFTDENSVHPKVVELQQSRALDGFAFGTGLLSVALRKKPDSLKENSLDLEHPDSTPLLWAIFQQIILIDTNIATNDVATVVGAFVKAIETLLEFLAEEKKKRLKAAQEEISSAFLPTPGADSGDDSGGAADDEDTDTPAPSSDSFEALFQAWKVTLGIFAQLDEKQQAQVTPLLEQWDFELADFADKAALRASLAARYSPDRQDIQDIQRTNVDLFLEDLRKILNAPDQKGQTEASEQEEGDEPTSAVPPTAALPGEEALGTETAKSAHNISRVARAKFELLEMINQSLYEELEVLRRETGIELSNTDLEAFIHRQQGSLSQDVWLRLLENGALTDKVDSAHIRRLWGSLTDEYMRRIVADIPTFGKPFVDAAMANSRLFGDDAQRFYQEWQEKQRAKERMARAEDEGKLAEIAGTLQPAAVENAFRQSQAFTINPTALREHIQAARAAFYEGSGLPNDPSLDAFLTKILQSAEAIRQSNDPEVITRAFDSLLAELDISDIGAVQQNPDLAHIQAQAYAHLWKSVFFSDPVLYAYFFALPEFAVAGEYLQGIRARWVKTFTDHPQSLNSTQLRVAGLWRDTTAVQKPGAANEAGYLHYDAKLPEQRQIDLEFALNLLYMSELDRNYQSSVETAIYSYFVLNQRQGIQLQQVMLLINNAQMTFENAEMMADLAENEEQAEQARQTGLENLQKHPEFGQNYQANAYHARNAISKQQESQNAAQKMQALMGAIKVGALAASGNWVGAAKELLTNKELQKQAKALIQKLMIANAIATLLPLLLLLAILKMIWEFIMKIVNFIVDVVTFPFHVGAAIGKAIGNAVSGAAHGLWNLGGDIVHGVGSLAQGAVSLGGEILGTGEAGDAAASVASAANQEAVAATKGAINGAQTVSYNTAMGVSSAAAEAGTAAIIAKVSGIALLMSMLLPTILTIIVFAVIGGSLNDLPAGFAGRGILQGNGAAGCWPAKGEIYQLPENPEHDVWHIGSGKGTAVDIAAPEGTPIYATFEGTARYFEMSTSVPYWGDTTGGYGNMVALEADLGFTLVFGHMSASDLPPGEPVHVTPGTVIGYVGNTGNSTGPHLHYESINPTYNVRDLLPNDPPFRLHQMVDPKDCQSSVTDPEACFQFVDGEKSWETSELTGIKGIIDIFKSEYSDILKKVCADGNVRVIRNGSRDDAGTPYSGLVSGRTIEIYDFCFDESQANCQFTFPHEFAHVLSNSISTSYLYSRYQSVITNCNSPMIHTYPLAPFAGQECSENFAESFMLYILQTNTDLDTGRCLPEAPNVPQLGEGATCEPFSFEDQYPEYYDFWSDNL